MMSDPGQTIIIHILLNSSRIKGNLAMKFGLLIECYKINIFLQKSCRKWDNETSSRPILFSKKALYEVKATGLPAFTCSKSTIKTPEQP